MHDLEFKLLSLLLSKNFHCQSLRVITGLLNLYNSSPGIELILSERSNYWVMVVGEAQLEKLSNVRGSVTTQQNKKVRIGVLKVQSEFDISNLLLFP